MSRYISRRLFFILPTLLGILFVNFMIINLAPGGPIHSLMSKQQDTGAQDGGGMGESIYKGEQGLRPEFIENLKKRWNLDGPWYERFGRMVYNYIRFDFGDSFFKQRPVTDIMIERLPVSITLGAWSFIITYMVCIPLGIAKAVRDGTRFDSITSFFIFVGYSIPPLLFGILLIVLFCGGSFLKIFPFSGLVSDNWDELSRIDQILDYIWHIILPIITLTLGGFAALTMLVKNSFLDEIKKQYVLTAKAKGASPKRVLYGHVFRNGMLLVISGLPFAIAGIFIEGSFIVEYIFDLDGFGLLGINAVIERDYNIIFGTLFIFSLLNLLLRLVSDLTYHWVDPRINFGAQEDGR